MKDKEDTEMLDWKNSKQRWKTGKKRLSNRKNPTVLDDCFGPVPGVSRFLEKKYWFIWI